ncbi:hypothetical protein LC612_07355 [Nostoc sp. CHAB 5834]|nr:hypothetical protein [Nostoc sp. CHAB 5834]
MQNLEQKWCVNRVAQAAQELAAAAKAEPNPKLAEILAMPNLEKLADKIG